MLEYKVESRLNFERKLVCSWKYFLQQMTVKVEQEFEQVGPCVSVTTEIAE